MPKFSLLLRIFLLLGILGQRFKPILQNNFPTGWNQTATLNLVLFCLPGTCIVGLVVKTKIQIFFIKLRVSTVWAVVTLKYIGSTTRSGYLSGVQCGLLVSVFTMRHICLRRQLSTFYSTAPC